MQAKKVSAFLNEFKRVLTAPSDWLGSSSSSVLIAFFNLREVNYNLQLDLLNIILNQARFMWNAIKSEG